MSENTTVLSTEITKNLLNNWKDYPVIYKDSLLNLENKLSNSMFTAVVLFMAFDDLCEKDKDYLLNILDIRKIKYINITYNIEDSLRTNKLKIYDKENLVLDGYTKDVLSNEKIIKNLGFKIPFIVDLSEQLKLYGVIKENYYDSRKLVDDLWS